MIKRKTRQSLQEILDDVRSQSMDLGTVLGILDYQYQFRHNTILDRTEFKTAEDSNFKLLTERDVNSIHLMLSKHGYKKQVSTIRSLLNSDFVNEVDPFRAYFESLPAWDGKTDYIAELSRTVKTTNSEFWLYCLRKWLVAVVACAINPGDVNHQVLVLSGRQGLGKTRWLNRLLPDELKGYLYSGIVNPNNKDTLVHLSENLLINLDELESLNRTELGNLKSLITQSAIRLRKAYGAFSENLIRHASFMGSVNDADFLSDTTGNRRYLCFTVTDIDTIYKVDINRVYRQAYELLNSGFKWWFEGDEIDQINVNNEDYLKTSSEEELLLKYFRKPQNDQIIEATTTDILLFIEQKLDGLGKGLLNSKKLGQALVKHGFQRKSVKNQKPYLLALNNVLAEKEEDTLDPDAAQSKAEQNTGNKGKDKTQKKLALSEVLKPDISKESKF